MTVTLENQLLNLGNVTYNFHPGRHPNLKDVEKAIFIVLGVSVVFRAPVDKEFCSSDSNVRELSKLLHSSLGKGKEITVSRWKDILSEFIVYDAGGRGSVLGCVPIKVPKNCIEIISPLGYMAAGNTHIDNVRFFRDDVAK